MINIDSLPKSIEHNGEIYMLDMHVTMWNKLCVSYKYSGGPKDAMEKKIEYFILSQVVEPDCKEIRHADDVTDIVDVGNWENAFIVIEDRIHNALDKGVIKLYK